MRLVPASIAGRTAMILAAGTLAVLAVGGVVASLGVLEDAAPRRNARLMERTVTLVSVLNAVPREARADVLASMNRPGLSLRWTEHAPPRPAGGHDWFSSWTERRLRRALAPLDVGTVMVGHEFGRDRPESGHRGRDQMWVELLRRARASTSRRASQALAEEGGICISGDAYRHVRGKIELGFADMGER